MTEESPKITSAIKTPREKNPGRVAAGKRLAAISKEQKRHKRENAIKEPCDKTSVILVGGLVVAVAALYFLKFHNTGTEGERSEKRHQRTFKVSSVLYG